MTPDSPSSASFRVTAQQAEGKDAVGFVVPPDVIEQLGHGARPPVRVRIGDHEFRYTVGVMGGRAMIGLSKAVRQAIGVGAGDEIDVELTIDASPRTADVPADFAEAMNGSGTRPFFDGLSSSLQRYHVDTINEAKTDDTRRRRIDKAISLFAAGKKR
ncbi:MAG TPA: YdeI/OmpD-associated family protein [Ilumatobacteraceae bacterium]|jgi:hypothetical protein